MWLTAQRPTDPPVLRGVSRRTGRGVSALGNPRDADVCGKSRPSRPLRACRRFRFECLLLGELESGLQHTHGRIGTIGMSPLQSPAPRRRERESSRAESGQPTPQIGRVRSGGTHRAIVSLAPPIRSSASGRGSLRGSARRLLATPESANRLRGRLLQSPVERSHMFARGETAAAPQDEHRFPRRGALPLLLAGLLAGGHGCKAPAHIRFVARVPDKADLEVEFETEDDGHRARDRADLVVIRAAGDRLERAPTACGHRFRPSAVVAPSCSSSRARSCLCCAQDASPNQRCLRSRLKT